MKPNFALSLSQDGVVLYRRVANGWEVAGTANPDSDAFRAEVAALTRIASVEGATTKLILPNSQILYADIDAPGPDRASRRMQIAKSLDGRTPYQLEDLAYDWSGTGRKVQVAVVANVTLEEAEAFAEENGFNPVSFVAAPEEGRFAGEPWFGTTSRSGDHIPFGERVDRDQDPVRVRPSAPHEATGVASVAAVEAGTSDVAHTSEADVEAGPAEPGETDEAPFIAIDDMDEPEDDLRAAPIVEEPPREDWGGEANAAAGDLTADVDVAQVPSGDGLEAEQSDEVQSDAKDVDLPPEVEAALDAALAATVDDPSDGQTVEAADPDPVTSDDTDLPTGDLNEVAPTPAAAVADPLPIEIPDPALVAGTLRIDDPKVPDPEIPAVSGAAFASRRKRGHGRFAAARAGEATKAEPALPPISHPAEPPFVAAPRLGSPTGSLEAVAAPRTPPVVAIPRADAKKAPGRIATAPVGTKRTVLRRVLARAASAAAAPKPLRSKPKSPAAEAAELTVFGARRRAEVGGKPRLLGVWLIAALIAIMAAVALLPGILGETNPPADVSTNQQGSATGIAAPDGSALTENASPDATPDGQILDEPGDVVPPADDPAATETQAATAPEEPVPSESAAADTAPAAPPAETPALTGATSSGVPQQDAGTEAAATALAAAAAAAGANSTEAATAPQPEATAAPESAAIAEPATPTGEAVWGALPDTTGEPDASAIRRDPGDEVPGGSASVLPATDVLVPDTEPALDAPPVPFDSLVRMGPDGLIVATAQGVLAPGGYMLFAGRPARVPAQRPDSVTAAAAALSQPAPETTTPAGAAPAAAEAPPAALPGIPSTRPLARPAGIAPDDGATAPVPPDTPLAAPADPRHAARKPVSRPDVIAARAALRADTEAAIAAAAAAAASAAPAAFPSATAFAVASSQRPATRPSSVAQAVEAALAAAVAEPAPEVLAAASATVVPEARPAAQPEPQVEAPAPEPQEVDEPEPQAAAPDIPTRASVAKQATIRNALDLGKINLIGVYGSSGDRRALVRTSNGRFVRVKVGDRIDGGKVAAIGETDLSYVKNGRTIVLKMIRDS